VHDNPIYAADQNYLKTLAALPSHLRRAFLDGDWEVFAGQYFDNFDVTRHIARAETIEWKPWWPRWISVDWGFEHPSATYWHAAAPGAAAVSSVGARHAVPERATCTHAPSTHNRATSGSESPADTSMNGVTSPSSSAGHGSAVPLRTDSSTSPNVTQPHQTVVTYREYVTHRTAPRDLAHEIIARSLARDDADGLCTAGLRPAHLPLGGSSPYSGTGPAGRRDSENDACAPSSRHNPFDLASRTTSQSTHEKIDAIYLSPDAFARRTDEASIADQMGDVFAAAGFPRPVPADNDRIGGWMLMYQMLDADEWLLTDNCIELIRTIPTLVRDMARIEDIEKMDGDDPADAARYGLKSRYATRAAYSIERLPYQARLAARVLSADPTVRAIQARKAQLEEQRRTTPVSFRHRRR
jgi:hypothetical protein